MYYLRLVSDWNAISLGPSAHAYITDDSPVVDFAIDDNENEASWSIGLQVFIPYVIAGFGMVSAGLLLDYVQVKIVHRGAIPTIHLTMQSILRIHI